MLSVTEGVATVMVGLFIVGSESLNVPVKSKGRATAIYDSTVGSCASVAGGDVVVRCDTPDNHAQTRGNQASSAVREDSTWVNVVVMGPDPGGKASKESGDQERGSAKPTPSTSPSPKPSQTPGDEESRQKRS